MKYDINDRFELLIFETIEEYLERRAKEKEKIKRKIAIEKKEIEKKGCENCPGERPRWVLDEFYVCYECFIYGLDCESSVMVPPRGADQMKDYMEESEWDARWEEENDYDYTPDW